MEENANSIMSKCLPYAFTTGSHTDLELLSTRLVCMGLPVRDVDQWRNTENNRYMHEIVYSTLTSITSGTAQGIPGAYSSQAAMQPTVLLDSGTFNHNFGRDTVMYRVNFRDVQPFPIQTAGGIVFLDQQCDLAMPGIYISNGFVNDHIPTTLVSEGVLVREHMWEFNTSPRGKLVKHPRGQFWAEPHGNLHYLPADMVGVDEIMQHADTAAGGVVCDTRDKTKAQHDKSGHRPKMDGYDACEKAYMQAKAARKGAKVRGEMNTVNGDLIDVVHPDNNGDRYGFDAIVIKTSFRDVAMMSTKDSATTAKAWRKKILPRLESLSAPGRPEDYKVERFHHDHGTEFEVGK